MLGEIFKKITPEEINELESKIKDFLFIEFTLSELYQDEPKSLGAFKYKRMHKYLSKHYDQVDCGCSETRFKKEV